MFPLAGVDGVSREEMQRHAIEGLSQAVNLARGTGITVTFERFHRTTSPFVTSDEANRAGSLVPDLKIAYDNGNVMSGGEDLRTRQFLAAREQSTRIKLARAFVAGKTRNARTILRRNHPGRP